MVPNLGLLFVGDGQKALPEFSQSKTWSSLCDMIQRSNCSLSVLGMKGWFGATPLSLPLHFPEIFDQLEVLILDADAFLTRGYQWTNGSGGDSLFLSHLHISPADSSLPSLRQLDLTLDYTHCRDSEFVSMVQSRWNVGSGRRLQSVSLRIRKGVFNNRHWEPLQRMQEQGLRIAVRDRRGDVRTRVEEAIKRKVKLQVESGV